MESSGRGTVTLFVSNLPTRLHWSGLRQAFGRHGDVVESFILKKLDREGKRFGFVRFSNKQDANRAIERLNGFSCSKSVMERLHSWGLGELKIKSMGGRRFLIEVPDEELLRLLEEQNWSLLEEVFMNIEKWSESFQVPERITWVEVIGIPLHCGNHMTFKRIAESWGSLIALGENANQYFGCDKISLQISTSQMQTIDEVIELEVGMDKFDVLIVEITFLRVVCGNGKASPGSKPEKKANPVVVESSSESTTDSDHRVNTINSGDNYLGTDDAFTECIGMSHNDYAADMEREENRFIGEEELLGSRIEINDLEQGFTLENSKLKTGPSETDTVGNGLSEALVNGGLDDVNLGHNKAMEDVGFMGFKNNKLIKMGVQDEEADI
ncbi:hypothetical protein V6N13_129988 [Hibiscus sabdariffa]